MAFTTTGTNIITDAARLLQDVGSDGITPNYVRWKEEEYLAGVNDGCKAICSFKPDAYVISASVVLIAGIVQELPAAGHFLQDILYNMGTGGATPGTAIRMIQRNVLDAMNPSWPSATASATVEYAVFDERYPRQFLVSPPQPSSGFGYVQMMYSAAPAEIEADETILIPDIYRPALLQYEMFYLYSKDSEQPENANKAAGYYQAFLNALSVKQDTEARETPKIGA
jgi:Family of unknown function (DUF6682)